MLYTSLYFFLYVFEHLVHPESQGVPDYLAVISVSDVLSKALLIFKNAHNYGIYYAFFVAQYIHP